MLLEYKKHKKLLHHVIFLSCLLNNYELNKYLYFLFWHIMMGVIFQNIFKKLDKKHSPDFFRVTRYMYKVV
jgi:hypothetical protein